MASPRSFNSRNKNPTSSLMDFGAAPSLRRKLWYCFTVSSETSICVIADKSGDMANCVLGESRRSMPQFIVFQVFVRLLPDGLHTLFSGVGDVVVSLFQVPSALSLSILRDGF